MPITLPPHTEADLVESIKRFFWTEREDEIGDLQAAFFLEFVLKEIGPSIYNQAVRDAQVSLQNTVADLDTTLHEPEMGYTTEQRTRTARRGR